MTPTPDISVVMSVYNGAHTLRETIDSILSQEGVHLEFVVVDDGSTDRTRTILSEYKKADSRVKVITQSNQGLTKALIAGCDSAQGKYIARQDVGDVSLPGRLAKQLDVLAKRPDASFVSCGTTYVGPQGEYLYQVTRSPSNATERLLNLDPYMIQGPSSHPSTMFPTALYKAIGGYRPEFYFAQDIDLWIRFAERGAHVVMTEILYQATFEVRSISGRHRGEQMQTLRLIAESARLRRKGMPDDDILKAARFIGSSVSATTESKRAIRGKALYFIGACLRKNDDPRAKKYFKQALLADPLNLKSALRVLIG